MKFILFFFLFLGLIGPALAQETETEQPYLIITPIEFPERFKEFEKQQVEKIVLKGCAKQTGYQVILGDPPASKKAKWQLYKVEVNIVPTENGNTISATLSDARKSKVLNSIIEDNIPVLEFFRRLEIIIDRLFDPVEDFGKRIMEVTPSERPTRPKPEQITPAIPESKAANINFRERIMDLKTDVNLAVAKASLQTKEAKKTDAGKDTDNSTKKNSAANANQEGQMVANPFDNVQPGAPKPVPPIDMGHSIRLGHYSFDTAAKHYIDTDSHPKYLLFDYEFVRRWSHDSDFYNHFNIRYGKVLNKEEKEFAPYTGGAVLLGYNVARFGWMPKLGLEADTISFKNLPEPGKGLQIANNQIIWFNLSSVNKFTIFNRGFRLAAGYSSPLMVKSGYKGMDGASLSGSKLNFTVAALDIYKGLHFEVNYFTSQLQANSEQKITFSTTGVGFNAFYNF